MYGCTALHYAAKMGYIKIMQKLIEWGAALEIEDYEGGTPFIAAVDHGRRNSVKYLLDQNVNVHHITHTGISSLLSVIGIALMILSIYLSPLILTCEFLGEIMTNCT